MGYCIITYQDGTKEVLGDVELAKKKEDIGLVTPEQHEAEEAER